MTRHDTPKSSARGNPPAHRFRVIVLLSPPSFSPFSLLAPAVYTLFFFLLAFYLLFVERRSAATTRITKPATCWLVPPDSRLWREKGDVDVSFEFQKINARRIRLVSSPEAASL